MNTQAEILSAVNIVPAKADEEGWKLQITWSDGSTETLDGRWVIKKD